MRLKRQLLAGLFLCLLMGSAQSTPLPDISQWTLMDAWGETVTVDPVGKPVLLFFWASWCPFCHKLMPYMQRIEDDFAGKGLLFYSINVWETGDAMAYMFDHEYEFPVLVDGEALAGKYGVKGTPGVLLFGPDSKLIYRRLGGSKPEDVDDRLRLEIGKLLSPR